MDISPQSDITYEELILFTVSFFDFHFISVNLSDITYEELIRINFPYLAFSLGNVGHYL